LFVFLLQLQGQLISPRIATRAVASYSPEQEGDPTTVGPFIKNQKSLTVLRRILPYGLYCVVCCYASKELHVCYVSFAKSSMDQNSIWLWLRLCTSIICVNGLVHCVLLLWAVLPSLQNSVNELFLVPLYKCSMKLANVLSIGLHVLLHSS
jgi:hypothetical protein